MKVTNWRRKLAASLVAGGLVAPGAAYAQSLNTNLAVDPSFENVDVNTLFCFSAVKLNSWSNGTQPGFAYNINQAYDAGGPLTGGGTYYFTPNGDNDFMNGATDVEAPGQVSQNISVNSGAVAAQIASGEAAVKLSAFFTSYTNPGGVNDGDLGHLQVDFLNAGGVNLGSARISTKNPTTWTQSTGAGSIPVGTATLRASVFGTPMSGGPDGYIDLVDVQVTQAVNQLAFLEVNTTTGQVAIKNQTGSSFHIDFYEIKAPGPPGDYNDNGKIDTADYVVWRNAGATDTLPNDSTPGVVDVADYNLWKANFGNVVATLNATAWNSLQEQNLAGFPAGNGTGNGWEQAGGSNSGVLGESYLTGNSVLANGANINIGAAFNVGSPQNLEFRYAVVPDDGMGGFNGPGTFVRGFVRYVTSGSGTIAGVPEPSTVLLVGIGMGSLAFGGRGSGRNRTK
jgi:hypothetical protein